MKTLEEIDIKKPLEQEDFFQIFNQQLPLNEEEKTKIVCEYFPVYKVFLGGEGVTPEGAFIAVRQIFLSQEQQIGERMKNE